MRREQACFLVKERPLWGCCRDGLRKDEVHCMVTDGGGSPCLPESMAPVVATSVAITRHPWCSSQPGDYSLGKEGQPRGEVHIVSQRHITWPAKGENQQTEKRPQQSDSVVKPCSHGISGSRMVGRWVDRVS
jgi:hypothetical protein